ncbi:DUF3300 domain-containing protein [Reyranella sp.]|uniref:DUF3300 domain-containing protein n=1 Tax=Reyranella sp. TaxID=1929291 RepID=UPI0027322652|nr:DUF3300 domain-containing protein [Reyranella sp.]MDP2372653.1 DUF3300 domain-containing protein [Reyranella sp.]
MERRKLLALSTAMLALAPLRALHAQSTTKPFTSEQLDQMLAPIALYPDALLAQTLMAAGYPLEVVDAARWSKANPNLKGDAAVAAVKDKSWDVSVKSLTAFPQVLKMMNDQLDWTQKIGDAMIAQQKDVAESVQRLRAKAAAAGNLKSTPQQKVTTQAAGGSSTIVIEPANPDVVYVPYYNPAWAYGPWPYPAYPPPYYPPPPNYGAALMTGMMFGVGMAAGAAMFGGWNWNHGNTYVNVNRATSISANNFNASHYANGTWSHDATHRDGVPYRDPGLQQKYGQNRPGSAERDQYRGQQFQNELRGGQAGQRDGAARSNVEQRAGAERTGGTQVMRGSGEARSSGAGRSDAFSGVDRGQQVNREADRGRSYGGGGRSFGGGGRGGRR